jgi:hypothetical protein
MRRATSFLGWTVALEVVWALIVGTTQSTELIDGLAAALLGAVFSDVLRSRGLLSFSVEPRFLAKAWKLPFLVSFDFVLATWVLVSSLAHGRRVRGTWVTVPFPTEPGARGRWQRAFGVAASNGAANAIVVDLDKGEALLHALRSDVFSGRSVL